MTDQHRPGVGVGLIIVRGKQVLIGYRQGAHGTGTWGFPGGHLEYGESFADCARRENAEESGVSISKPKLITCTNDVFEAEGKHYVTIFMRAEWLSGEPQNLEPNKLKEWRWVSWDDLDTLPEKLFLPIIHLRATGYSPIKL